MIIVAISKGIIDGLHEDNIEIDCPITDNWKKDIGAADRKLKLYIVTYEYYDVDTFNCHYSYDWWVNHYCYAPTL